MTLFDRIRHKVINVLTNKKLRVDNFGFVVIPYVYGKELGPTEPWMSKLLAKVMPSNPGTFVDVGINLGQTLIKVKTIDPERKYVGFEPNPECVSYVNNVVEVNSFDDCTVVPSGLASNTGIGVLYSITDGAVDSAATIIENFRPEHKIVKREYISLLNLGKNFEVIEELRDAAGIIKVDVEGAELEVLASMESLIARDRPLIILEILPVYTTNPREERRLRQSQLLSRMEALGYLLFRIEGKHSNEIGFSRLDCIEDHDDLSLCDYVFVHQDKQFAFG